MATLKPTRVLVLILFTNLTVMSCLRAQQPDISNSDRFPGPARQDTSHQTPKAPVEESKVLASVTLEDGHEIVFRQSSSGILSVAETVTVLQTPILGHSVIGKSMADIFRMVRPKTPVPSALVEADSRLAALRSQKSSEAQSAPPPQVQGSGSGPKLYNAGEQQWFKTTFCHDSADPLSLLQCVQGWDWITSGWQRGALFASETMVGAEGSPGNLHVYYWNGQNEIQLDSAVIKPGTYRWGYWSYYQPFWWHLNLDGAGPNTQVSQDIRTCGNGGQWACSRDCGGTISCNPENTTYCSIVGAHGESWCNNR